ncbi:MAG: ZIP family metal transporter [candidate division KSB1 bacterium]|nr:ZIP family metal transporter [candidate division KSB1 bacterium]MDZ7274123.1 ZIP family metal transporter [candidate division KSB1 bacterium]MDZ7287833.1 ZIP family metal transporter [candidate division KSB1 bacterium]MDZ7296721.1 ZIP family metal transporter [candidate division KSB1 bacterium]MDZ7307711.1 ZIP family metal transporter [candidate division KSB1 bacterium]
MPFEILLQSVVAGLLASLACGLGALPLLFKRLDLAHRTGLGYGFAGGLMLAASVYNLILPGLTMTQHSMTLMQVLPVLSGILLGALFLWAVNQYLDEERLARDSWKRWGNRAEILIFLAMSVHSIPEGVAVGVGYASEKVYQTQLGSYIALAIAIHNIPEGLAVAIPLRSAGASILKCFFAAFLTSLPQPIAAVPAALASWFFQPLMPVLMGFAAGAMIFLILLEMIPGALNEEKPARIAWAFILGFCLMLLVQVVL